MALLIKNYKTVLKPLLGMKPYEEFYADQGMKLRRNAKSVQYNPHLWSMALLLPTPKLDHRRIETNNLMVQSTRSDTHRIINPHGNTSLTGTIGLKIQKNHSTLDSLVN